MTNDASRERANRAYHHGDLRNALIAAGRELLAEEGLAGLDLRKVARRAGVSHAAPYRHFADKQALLAAIAEDGFHQLATHVAAALADAPEDIQLQLIALGWAYVEFALDHPAHTRAMFSGLTAEQGPYPTLYAASKVAFNYTVQTIYRGQAQGVVKPGDPIELTLVTWSQIHGLAMLLLEDQIPEARGNRAVARQIVELCIQTLYGGLRTED